MSHTIGKEIKELFSDKKIWIGILTVLIIFIIGTSYHVQNTSEPSAQLLKLGVINKDDSAYSKLLLNYLSSSKTFTSFVEVVTGTEDEIKDEFQQGKLDVYLEIPKDFTMNMMKLENSPISVTLNIKDTTKAILFQNVLNSYEKYIASVEVNAVGLYDIMEEAGMDSSLVTKTNRTVSIDLIFTALGKEEFFNFKPISQFPMTSILHYYIGSVLVMSSLYFGLYAGYQLLKEMQQGTFTRLRTTKTSFPLFVTAKLAVYLGLLTLFTASALFLLSRRALSIDIILSCVAFAMFSICQAVFLCALFGTVQRFILIGNLLLFYFSIIGGGIIPIQFLPQDMLTLSRFTPFYYILRSILNISQGQLRGISTATAGFIMISIGLYCIAVAILHRRSVIHDDI